MAGLFPCLVALIAVVVLAVVLGSCSSGAFVEDEPPDEPVLIPMSASDFLEFLRRIREAIRQSQRA